MGVIMLKIQLCYLRNKLYLKYILKWKTIILNGNNVIFHNITVNTKFDFSFGIQLG